MAEIIKLLTDMLIGVYPKDESQNTSNIRPNSIRHCQRFNWKRPNEMSPLVLT